MSMKRWIVLAAALAAGPARAYDSVDCTVNVSVRSRVDRLDLDQEVGSERLRCAADASGATTEARVVRIAKTNATAQAGASADASADARSRYSDSCTGSCSCSNGGWGSASSCSTSGGGSGYCSSSRSDSASAAKNAETEFTVARATLKALADQGFSARPGPDAGSCELIDAKGGAVDVLKAIAVVTWIYGQQLMSDTGAAAGPAVQDPKTVPVSLPAVEAGKLRSPPFDQGAPAAAPGGVSQ